MIAFNDFEYSELIAFVFIGKSSRLNGSGFKISISSSRNAVIDIPNNKKPPRSTGKSRFFRGGRLDAFYFFTSHFYILLI